MSEEYEIKLKEKDDYITQVKINLKIHIHTFVANLLQSTLLSSSFHKSEQDYQIVVKIVL